MRSIARADDMGRRWSLETDRGRWAVRTMDTWWPIVDAEADVALQQAAAAAGVLLTAPVRSRAGSIIESIDGHSWRVNEWLHSGPPLSAPASSSVTREVGRILATIHGLALPVDRISPLHHSRLSTVGWPELAATATAVRANWAGARALVDGYRAKAGALPPLDLTMFRGAVNSLANYVFGQAQTALDTHGTEDRRYADRSVRHLLSHLPTRAVLEQLLGEAASTRCGPPSRRP